MKFLTTFNSPFGRFRFKRMLFGVTIVGDTFQNRLNGIFSKLHVVTSIADDVTVWEDQAYRSG